VNNWLGMEWDSEDKAPFYLLQRDAPPEAVTGRRSDT